MDTDNTFCAHCDPYKSDPRHIHDRIQKIFSPVLYCFSVFDHPLKFFNVHAVLNRFFLKNFFRFLIFTRALKEETAYTEEEINSRTLVILREAEKKKIPCKSITFFNNPTNFFSMIIHGKKEFFEGLPGIGVERVLEIDCDDKAQVKRILRKHGLPHPTGKSFVNRARAMRYAQELGFPLVIKPRSGSLSKHTTCNIKSLDELQEAITIAKIIEPEFIVERFVAGDVYRITLVNHNVIACCLREPPNVVGSGEHTIKELIDIKNSHPWRGESNQKSFTLHKIPITPGVIAFLAQQKYTLADIPLKGNKIYVHDKVILAYGADIHDATDQLHSETKDMLEHVSRLLKSSIVGFDFICTQINESYHKQESAILEANSLPYIDMHHYPVTGQPINVARHILDHTIKGSSKNNV